MMANPPQKRDSIRWGIVGLGDVCQKKSGPAFWKCTGSQLVAVMRRTPGKAQEFARRVPGGECVGYDTLAEFLQHPGLDAVYVSTRPGTHLEICKEVAKAGKACYVEKPVGRCAEETVEIVNAFENSALPLYTAYISRAYDRTQAVRQLLRDGVIGDRLIHVSYNLMGMGGARDMMMDQLPWRLDAQQSGGGLIMDVGCHVLDRIDYICGPIVDVDGNAENRKGTHDVEDYIHFRAKVGPSSWTSMLNKNSNGSEDAVSVECTWDFGSTNARDELIFVGSNGSLQMAGMSPNGPIQVLDVEGNIVQELQFDMPEHTAQQLIQAVTNDLLQGGPEGLQGRGPPDSSTPDYLSLGDNAIRTQKVLDTILSSYYGSRGIGYWNEPDTWPGRPTRLQ